jgi:DNA uptake protein ComE-like DNA-binding protein
MKNWRDFLYFSKGERRILSVLTVLIVFGGILLVVHDTKKEKDADEMQFRYIVHPENAPVPVPIDKAENPEKPSPAPKKTSGGKTPARKPQKFSSARTEKFPAGTLVELNTADTTTLKKVPGIGSFFARRIVEYRSSLGGFYSVAQLREVYRMDEERYLSLQNWFYADTSFIAKLPVNHLSFKTLIKHPYLNYEQVLTLKQLCSRKGKLEGWENLQLLEEFTEADRERLSAYLSFQ